MYLTFFRYLTFLSHIPTTLQVSSKSGSPLRPFPQPLLSLSSQTSGSIPSLSLPVPVPSEHASLKWCHFGILIILSGRPLKNHRWEKGFLSSSFLPKSRSWDFPWKVCPPCTRKRIFLSLETQSWCQNKLVQTNLLKLPYLSLVLSSFVNGFSIQWPIIYCSCPSPFILSNPHNLFFVWKVCQFSVLPASLDLHFPHEDSHMHLKILKTAWFSPVNLSYVSLILRPSHRT